MRCLLDTHMALAVLGNYIEERYPAAGKLMRTQDFVGFVSVVSLWEIAIKSRLGKLDPGMRLQAMQPTLEGTGLTILAVDAAHVVTAVEPEPPTRDPFDRLLLAQCEVEHLKLITIDRALADHRLAFKFSPK